MQITCSLLKPSLTTFVLDADVIRFSSNLTVSSALKWSLVSASPSGVVTSSGECSSRSKPAEPGSSGNVTSG